MNGEVSMMSGFSAESSFVGRRLDMLADNDEMEEEEATNDNKNDDKKENQGQNVHKRGIKNNVSVEKESKEYLAANSHSLHLEDMETSIMSRVSSWWRRIVFLSLCF